jgi:hypothetical protein
MELEHFVQISVPSLLPRKTVRNKQLLAFGYISATTIKKHTPSNSNIDQHHCKRTELQNSICQCIPCCNKFEVKGSELCRFELFNRPRGQTTLLLIARPFEP